MGYRTGLSHDEGLAFLASRLRRCYGAYRLSATAERFVSPRLSLRGLAATLNIMMDDFELLGEVTRIEVIAVNLSIRERKRLKTQFGGRRWRKLKGEGRVRFPNGEIRQAELHWYEAHGIGRRKMKVKRVLD